MQSDFENFAKIPPHNLEAERAVLGACLLDASAVISALELLTAEDFYDGRHRMAFEIMEQMSAKDMAVDLLTFGDELNKRNLSERLGGQVFTAGLVDAVTTTANTEHHATLVRDKATHRKLIHAGSEIIRMGYAQEHERDETLDTAERLVFDISGGGSSASMRPLNQVLNITFKGIEERYSEGSFITGTTTGYDDFDKITGGLQPGSLNILAARPSMGKTALALNMAQNAAVKKGLPVLIFSLEMGAEQLAQRLLGAQARVNIHDLRTGRFHESAWRSLAEASGVLSQSPIYIDDSSMLSTMELRSRCRRFIAKHGELGLVVVDYLQLMTLSQKIENKQQEVAEISRCLKSVAREFNIPLLALSQLSRAVESRNDKRPQLSDLRDSGAIEQDADLVVLLYRAGYYEREQNNNEAEAIIAKHRNGPTGVVKFVFLREYARFESASVGNGSYGMS